MAHAKPNAPQIARSLFDFLSLVSNSIVTGPPPSLLVVVLDTNPYAWSLLSPSLTLSQAVANLLVFINAHLAFSHENKVAVIASHSQRTRWLYPTPSISSHTDTSVAANGTAGAPRHEPQKATPSSANKYRTFALIESSILLSLNALLATTTPAELAGTYTTQIAGALTQALAYIKRTTLSLTASHNHVGPSSTANDSSAGGPSDSYTSARPPINARILILSTSGDLAAQYIPAHERHVRFTAQPRAHRRAQARGRYRTAPAGLLHHCGDIHLARQQRN